uniref:Uncharacterized protein n=1 Tax=Rhizophora mucronata TaxID=61149 RepID=A0A2P2K854_RHIMU
MNLVLRPVQVQVQVQAALRMIQLILLFQQTTATLRQLLVKAVHNLHPIRFLKLRLQLRAQN